MIREFNLDDISEIDELLKPFNYSLQNNLDKGVFLKALVYDDDKIKGVLIYDYIYDRIEIEYIIVDKQYRRQKIATKLLNYLIEITKNIDNITLEVRSSNTSAIKLYESLNFKNVSIRKNYYKDEDGILMMRKMGD